MIVIKDNEDSDVFIPEDIFEEIAESVLHNLKDRRGIGQELDSIENNDPEIYVEIVKEAADTIHKEIIEFVNCKYLNGPDHDHEVDNMKILSITEARKELNKLFERNMTKVASS